VLVGESHEGSEAMKLPTDASIHTQPRAPIPLAGK
jgi:hypothetical protein